MIERGPSSFLENTICICPSWWLTSVKHLTMIGFLSDALVCEITEERNGIYELYMEYPSEGQNADKIVPDNIITAPTSEPGDTLELRTQREGTSGQVFYVVKETTIQPFRIYKVERGTDERLLVYAEHVSYELLNIPVSPFSASGLAASLAGLKSNSIQTNYFDFYAVIPYGETAPPGVFTLTEPTQLRSALMGQQGSILDVFGGGEYKFDCQTVDFYPATSSIHRGADRGVVIEYGKSIEELKNELDISGIYTGVCPFWKGGENGETVVTIPEGAVWNSYADSLSYKRTAVVDFSGDFETRPTEAQLRAKAQSYLAANGATGIPNTITVQVVPYLDSADFEVRSGYPPTITMAAGEITNVQPAYSSRARVIRLCDTVTIECPPLGISKKAKVVKTVWDAIALRYKELTIGQVAQSLAGTIVDIGNAADGAAAASAQTFLPVSGGTVYGNLNVSGNAAVGGALSLANNTWNTVGDDAQIGDVNAAGLIGIRGLNGATGIRFVPNVGNTNNVALDLWSDGAGTMRVNGDFGITGGYYVNDKPYIMLKEFSFSASCGAGVTNTQTGDIEFSGYTPIGVIGYNVDGTSKISVSRIQAYSNNQVSWRLVNQGSSAYSGTIWIDILYMAT